MIYYYFLILALFSVLNETLNKLRQVAVGVYKQLGGLDQYVIRSYKHVIDDSKLTCIE